MQDIKATFRKSIAIVIGIDQYTGGIPQLRSAVNDASRLGNVLQQEHGYELTLLLDTQATFSVLEKLLTETLPELVGPDDRLIFYFAGHGVALDGDDGPRGYILPQDARPGEAASYFEMTTLHDTLMELPCRHMLLVLDSCFSGAFRWSSTREVISTPGVLHQERFNRFLVDPAWQVLTSAAYDQTASDQLLTGALGSRGESGSHSPFAMALFDALNGAADLVPAGGDGVITATELFLYLEECLQPETIEQGCRQTPGLWPLRKHDKGEFVFLVPGRETQLPPAPELSFENNPYMGLSSYNKEDSAVFFGRGKAIKSLTSEVEQHSLLVVLGASGSGKSSLVKAGVVPELEALGWQLGAIVRPGNAPLAALASALSTPDSNCEPTVAGITSTISELLAEPALRLLLVIDQFEELITITRSAKLRSEFLGLLVQLVRMEGERLRIVLTLRTDFEAQFDHADLSALWKKGRYIVPPMSRQDYREVIEEPASKRVLYFEPASLVDELLDEVVAMPGGLPLLSFTLSEMYRAYISRQGDDRSLTQSDYRELGGVTGALRTRADAEYLRLDPAAQDTLRRLMLRMMVLDHGTPARQRVTREELRHGDADESKRITLILERLTEARLIVDAVSDEGIAYVEPAHDALVSSWGRLLEWVHEAQDREPSLHFLHALARTALDWKQAGKADRPGLLWRDKLRSTRLWALRKSQPLQLSQIEDEFTRASVARRRLIKAGVGSSLAAIVIAGVLAIGFAIVAGEQRETALSQRDEAQLQTRRALASAFTAKAGTALEGQQHPTLSLKLAATALQIDPGSESAAWAVRKAIYGEGLLWRDGQPFTQPFYKVLDENVFEAHWSPDGKHIAVQKFDSDNRLWIEIISKDGVHRNELPGEAYSMGGFSADSRYYLMNDSAWDLQGAKVSDSFAAKLVPAARPGQSLVHENFNTVWYQAWSQDGRIRAGHGDLGSRTWDDSVMDVGSFQVVIDGEPFGTLDGAWNQVALSPDGSLMATANYEGAVVLWSLNPDGWRPTQLAVLWQSSGSSNTTSLEFSADGSQLLAADRGGILRVWNLFWNPLPEKLPNVQSDANQAGMQLEIDEENLGNDTPFATVKATDPASGTEWSREFITSRISATAQGDYVAVADSDGLWLFSRQGVPEMNLKLNYSGYSEGSITSDSSAGAYIYSGEDDMFALVLSPTALIAMAAEAGYLEFSPAERVRWDVIDFATGSSNPTETGSIFDLMIDSFLGGQEPSEEKSKTEVVIDTDTPSKQDQQPAPPIITIDEDVLPIAWQILADSAEQRPKALEDWYSIRWLLSDLRKLGIQKALVRMGAPPPFLSGPHNGELWEIWDESFAHYNPAFLDWVGNVLLPAERSSALRQLTQASYDAYFRQWVRIYALSGQALQSYPQLRDQVLAEYDSLENSRGAYLFESLQPVAQSIGVRPEGEPEHFVWAAGFWIRRTLDGTAGKFDYGIGRVIELYDPDFAETLNATAIPPEA